MEEQGVARGHLAGHMGRGEGLPGVESWSELRQSAASDRLRVSTSTSPRTEPM
jgi:hypothetical protein